MIGVGEALVDVLMQLLHEGRPRLRQVTQWIAETARPPAGVRLVSDDGTEYSGFVIIERNEPRLMLALRVGVSREARPRDPPFRVPERHDPWRYEDGPFR